MGTTININIIIIYMHWVVREVNVGVLGRGLELLNASGGGFGMDQLFFADGPSIC